MVVFTCNHCGDSIQKPKAEKHYQTKCRNNFPNLCCVDCLKDFHGEDFKAHTKCISEAERYGGKGFVAKPNQNKGETKQNAWIEVVQSVLDENKKLSGSLRNLLERVSIQPNTPRKKAKFYNFVKSMDSRTTMKDIEAAWELLSAKLTQLNTISAASKQNNDSNKEPNEIANNNKEEKTEQENVETNGHSSKSHDKKANGTDDDASLSKKERKKLKKSEKYEAEINEMKSSKKQTIETNGMEVMKKSHVMSKSHDEKANETDDASLSKKERKKLKKSEKYEAEIKEMKSSKKQTIETNGVEVMKESRKRKHEEANDEKAGPKDKKVKKDSANEFDWKAAILSVLGAKGKDISLKKLQKRVLSEYCAQSNVTEVTERVVKKFNKGLHKLPNVKVENDKVFLTINETG